METKYNLEERTTKFAEEVIELTKAFSRGSISFPLAEQLVRAGTSIGANYSEAVQAASKKDFVNKIFICKKEANETMYWLRLLAKSNPEKQDKCRSLWKEAHEFVLMFSKAVTTARNGNNK